MGVVVAGVGYVGAKLVDDLLAAGNGVVGIDNFSATSPAAIRHLQRCPGFRFVRGSILNARVLREALKAVGEIQCVYHLAAQASAHPEAATPRYTENTNLIGARLLFEEAAAAGARKIVFASSLRVYGPALGGRVTEETPYGRFQDLSHLSKCYAEKLLEMIAHLRGLPAVSVRLGVVYGLSPVMKTDFAHMTVPNKFCLQAAREEALRVHPLARGAIGFIHASDASAALRAAAEHEWGQTYLAANAAGELCSVSALAARVRDLADARGLNVEVEDSVGANDAAATVASRLDEAGFHPRRSLADGLGEVIDYFVSQRRGGRRR